MIRQSDIARKLGLSESSVSRILAGKSNHDDETRAKVLALASQLGYRHLRPTVRKVTGLPKGRPAVVILIEASAQARSHLPAVIVRMLHGISEGARMEDASIAVEYVTRDESSTLHLARNRPKSLDQRNLAGLVLIGHYPVETLRELAQEFPCVLVCNADQELAPDSVGQNDTHATDELFTHLLELGHTSIGYLSEIPDFSPSQARLGGYAVALAKRGIPYNPSTVIIHPAPLGVGLWEKTYARALEQIKEGVTGWICNHDDVGYAFAEYLLQREIHVPYDASICGFDNLPPREGLPKLTSIEWPFEDIGVMAIRRVLRRARELTMSAISINFTGKLILGQSTAPRMGALAPTV